MSEEDKNNAPEDKEIDEANKSEDFNEERAKAKIAKANSEAANLRKRLKEAEAAEAKLKDLEDAKKSDLEKAAEKAKSLEDRAAKAELETLKLRIALRKGIGAEHIDKFVKRLTGSTEEELDADADELAEFFGTVASGKTPGGKPKESLRGGGDPTEEPEEMDPRKLAEMVPRN